MILIADAGSTKTKWCFFDESGYELNLTTSGINPHHSDNVRIREIIETELFPQADSAPDSIDAFYFYGSGVSSENIKENLTNLFHSIFHIYNISVNSDLLGTCRSLFGNEAGIAAILGTGSNSCYYDGKNITANVSPLGYILGDEGSGVHLGRTLVADLLKNQLTDQLKEMFFSEFDTDKDKILYNVYRKPEANRYLASLSVFLCRHIEEPECYDIVYKCFSEFFIRNIMQYDTAKHSKISFTGSVAENYKEVLSHVCEHYGITLGKIETNPIAGLIRYHLNLLQK